MKYSILLFACLVSLGLFGQNAAVKYHNKIDDLTTTEQVQKLVKHVYGKGGCDVRMWAKADLDNNGYTDLVVLCMYDTTWNGVLCLLDSGQNKFFIKKITQGDSEYDGTFPDLVQIEGHTVILYHLSDTNKIDTLIYFQSGFVEYNSQPLNYSIQKIEYETYGCPDTCPVFKLKIDGNKKANYIPQQMYGFDGEKIGSYDSSEYHAIIDPTNFKAIIELLNYIDFPKLDNEYGNDSFRDLPSCTLTVTYNNGYTKEIHDYEQRGTFGLSHLYDILSDLRKNQQWVKD